MDDGLPSVGMTRTFLALCKHYGWQQAAVGTVAQGCKAGRTYSLNTKSDRDGHACE